MAGKCMMQYQGKTPEALYYVYVCRQDYSEHRIGTRNQICG